MSEENPYGKTPEQILRSNRWFGIAVALGKQDDFLEMLKTEGEVRAMAMSEQTIQDARDKVWYNRGWESCRSGVLATAQNRSETAAVEWAREHPAFADPES